MVRVVSAALVEQLVSCLELGLRLGGVSGADRVKHLLDLGLGGSLSGLVSQVAGLVLSNSLFGRNRCSHAISPAEFLSVLPASVAPVVELSVSLPDSLVKDSLFLECVDK